MTIGGGRQTAFCHIPPTMIQVTIAGRRQSTSYYTYTEEDFWTKTSHHHIINYNDTGNDYRTEEITSHPILTLLRRQILPTMLHQQIEICDHQSKHGA